MNADVALLDLRWIVGERGEVFLSNSFARTDAAFDTLRMRFASNADPASFGGVLPGDGDDPGSPLEFHDYVGVESGFGIIHEFSELEFTQLRSTLGFDYRVNPNLGVFSAVSYYDLDDEGIFLQDATGSVVLLSGGFSWVF